MAAHNIVSTAVIPNNATIRTGIAGETIAAGEFIYKKASDGKYYKAQCDNTAEEATVAGICVSGGSASQTIAFVEEGDITTNTVGWAAADLIVLHQTAGKAGPAADLVSTNRLVLLGWATGAQAFRLTIKNTGVVK